LVLGKVHIPQDTFPTQILPFVKNVVVVYTRGHQNSFLCKIYMVVVSHVCVPTSFSLVLRLCCVVWENAP
jgi:hypothetical protein